MSRGSAVVVEAEPVDHALVGVESKQARLWIAGLRPRSDGADFDEPEAQTEQRIRYLRIFVEPCGKTDRIGEFESEGADRQFVTVGRRLDHRHVAQGLDRERMRVFGIEGTQQRAR